MQSCARVVCLVALVVTGCDVAPAEDDDAGADASAVCVSDADGDGHDALRCGGDDCDDTRRDASPDAPEVCDGIDNDCDSSIDEGVLVRCYVDADGDGYALADAASIETCECPVRTTSRSPADEADCDDTLAEVSPARAEICGNGRDDDCDGAIDEDGNDWFLDCDRDGYGAGTAVRACVAPEAPASCPEGAYVLLGGDCDDASDGAYPGAAEICDGSLNDCEGSVADGPEAADWCSGREPNVVALCSEGECVFERCATGFLDCASAPGCETDGLTDGRSCGACDGECLPWGGVGLCVMGECAGDPLEIAAGGLHTCARRASGAVDCWGRNVEGEIGDGTNTDRFIPTPVLGLADAVELAPGLYHSCARQRSGAVMCWGRTDDGQLGDGTAVAGGRTSPAPVSGLTDAVELAAGGYHTCARRGSGEVVCWGRNDDGQIGDGTQTLRRTLPTVVSGLTDAVELALGGRHTCARRASGEVVCWGRNAQGQIGDDTFMIRATPTAVSGLTDAVEIAAGSDHTCARRASGAVVCWGENALGRLGDGTVTRRLTPTAVSGLTDAVELGAGSMHTCARRTSGEVVCWGSNEYGQVGDGSGTVRLTFTAVTGLDDAVELAVGAQHTCARRAERNEVVCWGNNVRGQLGDGTADRRVTPTPALPAP